MGAQLWMSEVTGYRRRGTRLVELHDVLGRTITVRAIYEPLQSFSPDTDAIEARLELDVRDFDVAGVRESTETQVIGYIEKDRLAVGLRVRDFTRSVSSNDVVDESAPLIDLLAALAVRQFVFVAIDGGVEGIITQADLNKPLVRVYLFGIVSLLEMHLAFWIRNEYKDDSWREMLSASREKQILDVHGQRLNLDMFDCLQFADRSALFVQIESLRAELAPGSRLQIERWFRRARDLRDDLAHSQYYLNHKRSWEEIIALVRWVDNFLQRSDSLVERRVSQSLCDINVK